MRPPQAVFHVLGTVAGVVDGPDGDVLRLHRAPVPTREISIAGAGINDVRVAWIGDNVAALAATYVIPMLAADVAVVGAAGNANRAVVLLCSVEVVEELVIVSNVVELGGRLVVLGGPGLAAIDAHRRPPIITVNHALGINGVDPEGVMVAMRSGQ